MIRADLKYTRAVYGRFGFGREDKRERGRGKEKEKYGGFEETGEWFLIKHGSSQFQF